jgi:hypothetical protein
MTQIKSIEHLINECIDNQEDFFISFGFAKSSKTIEYLSEESEFYVFNDIDGSFDYMDSFELSKSNIGEAIQKGCFYKY